MAVTVGHLTQNPYLFRLLFPLSLATVVLIEINLHTKFEVCIFSRSILIEEVQIFESRSLYPVYRPTRFDLLLHISGSVSYTHLTLPTIYSV